MKTQILLFILIATISLDSAWSRGGPGVGVGNSKPVPHFIEHLVSTGQFVDAQKKLKYFVRREKSSFRAWSLLGKSQFETGELNGSLQSLQKALKIRPRHTGANRFLGELYLALGEDEKAHVQLDKLIQLCGSCDDYVALNQILSSNS